MFPDTGKVLQACEDAYSAVKAAHVAEAASLARAREALATWGRMLVRYKHNLPRAASAYSVAQRDPAFVAAVNGQ